MPETELEEKPKTTSEPEKQPEPAPEPPKAPEAEKCELTAKGTFLNGKGVMTAEGKCLDLGRLQVVLIEQNGRTYEYSRMSVR